MAKRIDATTLARVISTLYPPAFDVNLLQLPPGARSSQRLWHADSDELVYVLAGEVVLVTDDGEELLRAGDAAGFSARDPNGHCLQNRSDRDAQILEVRSRVADDTAYYADIGMAAPTAPMPRDGNPTRTSDAAACE